MGHLITEYKQNTVRNEDVWEWSEHECMRVLDKDKSLWASDVDPALWSRLILCRNWTVWGIYMLATDH